MYSCIRFSLLALTIRTCRSAEAHTLVFPSVDDRFSSATTFRLILMYDFIDVPVLRSTLVCHAAVMLGEYWRCAHTGLDECALAADCLSAQIVVSS